MMSIIKSKYLLAALCKKDTTIEYQNKSVIWLKI